MAEIKWATDERRLGPAYDDILAGRLKSASAIVERHLKKHPKSQPALVLRTVILERSESAETAILEAWGAVKKTGDLTTRSAWLIGTTFRNLGRRDLTLEIYQSQWANQPDSVELGEQVFLHAAAAWDRDTMVESSRKMFNKLKAPVWARVAAWSEWVKVSSPVLFPFDLLMPDLECLSTRLPRLVHPFQLQQPPRILHTAQLGSKELRVCRHSLAPSADPCLGG